MGGKSVAWNHYTRNSTMRRNSTEPDVWLPKKKCQACKTPLWPKEPTKGRKEEVSA